MSTIQHPLLSEEDIEMIEMVKKRPCCYLKVLTDRDAQDKWYEISALLAKPIVKCKQRFTQIRRLYYACKEQNDFSSRYVTNLLNFLGDKPKRGSCKNGPVSEFIEQNNSPVSELNEQNNGTVSEFYKQNNGPVSEFHEQNKSAVSEFDEQNNGPVSEFYKQNAKSEKIISNCAPPKKVVKKFASKRFRISKDMIDALLLTKILPRQRSVLEAIERTTVNILVGHSFHRNFVFEPPLSNPLAGMKAVGPYFIQNQHRITPDNNSKTTTLAITKETNTSALTGVYKLQEQPTYNIPITTALKASADLSTAEVCTSLEKEKTPEPFQRNTWLKTNILELPLSNPLTGKTAVATNLNQKKIRIISDEYINTTTLAIAKETNTTALTDVYKLQEQSTNNIRRTTGLMASNDRRTEVRTMNLQNAKTLEPFHINNRLKKNVYESPLFNPLTGMTAVGPNLNQKQYNITPDNYISTTTLTKVEGTNTTTSTDVIKLREQSTNNVLRTTGFMASADLRTEEFRKTNSDIENTQEPIHRNNMLKNPITECIKINQPNLNHSDKGIQNQKKIGQFSFTPSVASMNDLIEDVVQSCFGAPSLETMIRRKIISEGKDPNNVELFFKNISEYVSSRLPLDEQKELRLRIHNLLLKEEFEGSLQAPSMCSAPEMDTTNNL